MPEQEEISSANDQIMKLLTGKVEEYHKEKRCQQKAWASGEIHGLCQGFCMCGVISAEDWKMIEDLLK